MAFDLKSSSARNVKLILSWLFGLVVLVIGLSNLFFVHPVPGVFFLLLSLVYFPPANDFLYEKFGMTIPPAVKIILGIFVIWFTLGVSDLGDIIDDLLSGDTNFPSLLGGAK